MLNKNQCLTLLVAAFFCGPMVILETVLAGETSRVFEIRTYYANDGKLGALLSRFRDHTVKLFEKHAMTNVGYWVPVDNQENKLVYILAYPSREARETAWKAFLADPAWKKAYQESIQNGRLVKKVQNEFLTGADFSKIR